MILFTVDYLIMHNVTMHKSNNAWDLGWNHGGLIVWGCITHNT